MFNLPVSFWKPFGLSAPKPVLKKSSYVSTFLTVPSAAERDPLITSPTLISAVVDLSLSVFVTGL